MTIDSTSGISSLANSMNTGQNDLTGQNGGSSAINDKASLGAAVVTASLDKLNSSDNSVNSDYQFQKDVLSGMLAGTGQITNTEA